MTFAPAVDCTPGASWFAAVDSGLTLLASEIAAAAVVDVAGPLADIVVAPSD